MLNSTSMPQTIRSMGEAVRRARGVVERVDCDVLGYTMTPGGTAKWPSGPESLRPEAVRPGRIAGYGSRWPSVQGGSMKRGGFLKRRRPIRKSRRIFGRGVTNKQLDDACRALVFARDGYRCLRCGATSHLQWCHVYSRRFISVRWNPDNSFTGCAGCHLWWHHRPIDSAAWWLSVRGEARVTMLRHLMQ